MNDATTQLVVVGPRVAGRRRLTGIQRQIWTSQKLAPGAPLANMGTAHRLSGTIDANRFVEAVDRVVRSADVLRTVVEDLPGKNAEVRVLAEPPQATSLLELPADEVQAWCEQRIDTPIDVTTCAYDSVLIRHGADDWTWWLDLHHLVTDAWSSMLVFESVAAHYGALGDEQADDAQNVLSFYDHAETTATGDTGEHSQGDWAGVTENGPILPYGARGPRTTAVTHHDVSTSQAITETPDRYRTFSPELSTLTLLATTLAATLHRLDGRHTVSLGIPVHHRAGPAARAMIGPLLEIHPLRVEIDPTETFAETFDRVHRALLELLRRARVSTAPEVELDAIINVQTARYAEFAGIPTTSEWHRSRHVETAHPIRVHAYDYGNGARIDVDLNDGLSTDGSHLTFPDHYARVLDAAIDDPNAVVGDIELITDAERRLIDSLNPPPLPGAFEAPVHRLIAERLRADPDHVVAEHDGVTMRATELDERADGVAHWLIEQGVGRGDRVGVRMPRSLDVLVAVHGILRSGAAFVMLDPDDPHDRHQVIIDDAELVAVLDEIPESVPNPQADSEATSGFDHTADLDDIAYVIYTSGSTGTPKGVPISHRGLADYLHNAVDAYPTESQLVMPMYSALVFDLSVTSLFLPQLVGGRTVVVSGEPLTALAAIAADPRITVLKATPSQLEILSRMVTEPLALEVVIVGGEAFRRPLALTVASLARGVRIFNEYGPAEAVVGCMIHEWDPDVDTGVDVPIGHATPGAEIHILDERRHRTPVGAWGELYVWRTGMAEGYLNLSEATQQKFGHVDGVSDHPLYRTGDRVRIERDVVVYGGRIDDQLSVSGVRLEPGEIEAALMRHPDVTNAVVRVWSPQANRIRRCERCGLGTDVPGIELGTDGICTTCVEFDRIAPQTTSWFRTPGDLDEALVAARARATGDIDCLHLLSGGKDSTYALYQLVERGWRVHALTLDNGFISEGAKANVRRSIADLGVTHEFVSTEAMNEIFRDSLDRFANVCNGCYKTIYTLATARAHELGIPVIVTGLSRGQFFETRLLPHQFEADRFDPDEIDRTVLQARRAYHQTRDAVTELLPEQAVFDRTDIDVLDEIEYLDFYRYVDVELATMYEFLEQRAPWVRPDDTGRSTNCLVNVVGIHTHQTERGYHNYAEPYSWDVRLGHKTRAEALEELDDEIDPTEIRPMLDEIGYEPRRPEILTAWYQSVDGSPVDVRLLSAHLRQILPSRAVPTAFVHVDDLPLADSTKLDVAALPPPSSTHLGSTDYTAPTNPTEAITADIWATVLDVDRVGLDDDFFDLGGASLAALETVAATERRFGVELPDALVFEHRRLRDFARAVETVIGTGHLLEQIPPLDASSPPPLSAGEEAMLFEYRSAPNDVRYNGMRHYVVPFAVDPERLARAVRQVVERHQPLHTAYDESRTRLPAEIAATIESLPAGATDDFIEHQRHIPFDLDHGPLVRVHVGSRQADQTDIVIAMHHISVDAGTFDVFWNDLDAAYHDRPLTTLETSYAAHGAWQRRTVRPESFPLSELDEFLGVDIGPAAAPEADGYLDRPASVSTTDLRTASATTPFGAALASVAVVLSAFSRDDVVELGLTASTKDHPTTDDVIGYFLNSLPLVLDIDGNQSLAEVDRSAGALVADLLSHRTAPFAEVVRWARRSGRRVPDISHMLAYEQLAPARFGQTEAALHIVMAPTAVNDLTFFVHEQGDTLGLGLEYRGSVVDAGRAQRMLDAFDRVLTALCHRPGLTVGQARADLVGDDIVGPPLAPDPVTPLRRLAEFARTTPDAVAVLEANGETTSYRELLERGLAIATSLGRDRPTGRRIGVSLPRSSRLIESIVGIHLAGDVYVPIDPAAPIARRRALLEAADLHTVIVDEQTASDYPDTPHIDVTSIDVATTVHLPTPDEIPTSGDAPAYVIFTSGSTGQPAGVEVSHANLAASTAARSVFYGSAAPHRFLVTPSIGFDSSLVGIFWPLATGGSVVMPDDADVHDVDRLAALVADLEVSHVLMVPSLYDALLERRAPLLAGLRTAIVAGEACHSALVRRHHELLPGVELVNEYGPTEATVWATAHRCSTSDDPVPIGLPIAGARVRVADEHQQPMAAGAPGELLIAGPGVVAGYRSGRSNDAFVDDGEYLWYRTGDLVHLDDRGRLVFLGRVDDQLNVGGLRLEPLELEAVILGVDGVDDAVVTAVEIDGRNSLVVHVVADPELADLAAIRSRAVERLGPAAAPRRVGYHEALPRTANGKLDRERAAGLPLSAPQSIPSTADRVVDIWRQALGLDDLGPDADFFEHGGDSLAAVAIVSALGALIGRDVQVATLLTSPTPHAMSLALGLADRSNPPATDAPVVTAVTLRPGTPGGPTVLMTTAWDSVMGYHALAQAFDPDVRVIAVAIADVDAEGGSSLLTVPELGSVSIDIALDAIGSLDGAPLAVLGWSIGGVAAYDLGQRLDDRGVDVARIVLVDTFFPGQHHHLWSNRWWKYKSMLRPGSFGETVRELAVMLRRRLTKVAARLGRRLLAWAGEPVSERSTAFEASGIPRSALDGDPTPSDLPVLLFAAHTTNPDRTINRWRTVASDLEIVPITGRHRGYQSVMGADRVHVIAEHLAELVLRPGDPNR